MIIWSGVKKMAERFSKFRGKGKSGKTSGKLVPRRSPNTVQTGKIVSEKPAIRDIGVVLGTNQGRFVIALDATGSMAQLIDMARQNIKTILTRITAEANCRIEIEVMVYRDYDVPETHLVERSGLQDNASALSRWLDARDVMGGGGNNGEAVEAALACAASMQDINAVLIAGDEPANPRGDIDAAGRRGQLTAVEIADAFGRRNIPVHTFVIGDYGPTVKSFGEIAHASGGKSGRLDGSATMIDQAVMAMLSALKGRSAVKQYMDKSALTASARDYGARLLEPPEKS